MVRKIKPQRTQRAQRVVIFLFHPLCVLCALCGFPKPYFENIKKSPGVLVAVTRDAKDPYSIDPDDWGAKMSAGLSGFAIDVGDEENLVIRIVHRYQASTIQSSFESVDPLPRGEQFRRG